ncbi:MAG: 4a-hydroxytetrahydrobiopterin dehydratase [Candidatus Parcubacteria bacterium]|nr:4a-hydroxytetrahydrobiopterin dehydratase [Candidatus Paceibacterota bacterium]
MTNTPNTPATPENWQVIDNKLVREFKFKNFQEALEWSVQVAMIAEEVNHHPEIMFTWGRVVISITTHDVGNQVTAKDIDLANDINDLEADLVD